MFPTLVNMPSAIALSALTAEARLAAILHRQMHLALPATLSKHAAVLMKLLLLAEVAIFIVRFAALAFEFLLLATARASAAPVGALLRSATAVLACAREPPAALAASVLFAATSVPERRNGTKDMFGIHAYQPDSCWA